MQCYETVKLKHCTPEWFNKFTRVLINENCFDRKKYIYQGIITLDNFRCYFKAMYLEVKIEQETKYLYLLNKEKN